jgi:membrane protease YdiL (CAAX protease family)
MDTGVHLPTAAGLFAYQWLINRRRLDGARYVASNLAVTTALMALARRRGLDVGLSAAPLRDSVGAGACVGGAAGLLLAALVATPKGRRALRDQRMAGLTGFDVAREVLGRIPFGTVVLEEVAFRGVLPALGSDALACAAFGLWHVPPTLRTLDANEVKKPRARAAAVAAAVAVTGIAGGFFCALRRRHGLVAPAVAHAVVNGLGTVASVAAHRLG